MAADRTVENGTPTSVRQVRPPITAPTPSMWGHILSTISFDDQLPEKYAEAIEELKKTVRSMLMDATSTKLILLVDTLERLGLAYHFDTEIEEKLREVYCDGENVDDYDLFTTALRFRLLRQHQYHVSCDVFEKFIVKDNKLKEVIATDVEGLLSLYEAVHIRYHNENILDEVVMFTTHHLTRLLPEIESPLKDKVQRALKHSIHRGILIINIPFYISIYGRDDSRNELLLKLAKLNFNLLQNMYKKEISELSRWWDKFDLKSKLPYARDRMVECYLWGTAFHFEPQYSYVRVEVAKNMQMVSIINDTYDNYATLEEDELFTQILNRWNMDEIDLLPDFMNVVYRFIMSIYEDFELEAEKTREVVCSSFLPRIKDVVFGSKQIFYIIQNTFLKRKKSTRYTVKQLCRAYNLEQKWVMEQQMPSFEEYTNNSVITSCIYVMLASLIPGIKSATQETIDWLSSEPKILIFTAKLGRHLDDLGSHERENREGKLLTVVDCYMKDRSITKQEALSQFVQLVENGWKDVNIEWTKRNSVPKEMLEQLLNYGRVAEVTYKNGEDGYTYPEKFLAPQIATLFLDPIIM